jgi:hypothetical protein
MKALSSVKLRRSSRQNSPGRQDLGINDKETPQPNSRDYSPLRRRIMKLLSSAKLRWSSRQNSPGRQVPKINDKESLEPSFEGKNEPFWGIPRIIYGPTYQNSSELQYIECGRISDFEEIPRDISDDDCPVVRG